MRSGKVFGGIMTLSMIVSINGKSLMNRLLLVTDACVPQYSCPADCETLLNDEYGLHCTCDELEFCKPDACHANGCDQCQDGYFKRDYASPCVTCESIFGDTCQQCADFNGCQQCVEGYDRVIDEDCGITSTNWYYCVPEECTQPPTNKPTDKPTYSPTDKPTNNPTDKPTNNPTDKPTNNPTDKPTHNPTDKPTESPDGGSTVPEECDLIRNEIIGEIEECEHDPCLCTEPNLNCIARTCHSNGCDQCLKGYFKKGYNYKCEQCQEVFGSACMFCTDFLGCQQCAQGTTRTYSVECMLWYCKEN